jgi:hypothetical protein|tara:strand:- start:607 stop:774 length:168 start_codon:yes stop_codon:yes gene_type:complete
MKTAGLVTILLLLIGSAVVFAVAVAFTAVIIALIGTPDDLNDVDIDGKPPREKIK